MYHMLRNRTPCSKSTNHIAHLRAYIKPDILWNLYFPKYFPSNLFTYSSHSGLYTR